MTVKEKRTNKLHRQLANPRAGKGTLATVGFWFAALAYWELILHAAVFGTPDARFGYVLGFGFAFACVLAVITS